MDRAQTFFFCIATTIVSLMVIVLLKQLTTTPISHAWLLTHLLFIHASISSTIFLILQFVRFQLKTTILNLPPLHVSVGMALHAQLQYVASYTYMHTITDHSPIAAIAFAASSRKIFTMAVSTVKLWLYSYSIRKNFKLKDTIKWRHLQLIVRHTYSQLLNKKKAAPSSIYVALMASEYAGNINIH